MAINDKYASTIVGYTGLLVLQDDQLILCTTALARRNYWAELAQILHGALKGVNSRFNRGVFGNSVWGPRYGVPKGSRVGSQRFCKIFSNFFIFFYWNGSGKV